MVLAGCATGEVSRVRDQPRAEISYAATATYPGEPETSEDLILTAVDDPRRRELTLYNPTDRSVPAGTVWINGHFLHRIHGIGPRGGTTIDYRNFLEAGDGVMDFRRVQQSVQRVDYETSEGLFTVQGPARVSR